MSGPSRAMVLSVFGTTIVYVLWVQDQGGLDSGSNADDFELFKNFLTLFTVNVGLFLTATLLGIVRVASASEESYRQSRSKILLFLAKWGGIYFAYTIIARFVLTSAGTGNEEAWMLVRFWGLYGFVGCLIVYFIVKGDKSPSK